MISKTSNVRETTGLNIKKIRISKGLSQQQLADLAEVHRTNISTIECGYNDCRLSTLERIAWGLKTPVSDLVKEGGN